MLKKWQILFATCSTSSCLSHNAGALGFFCPGILSCYTASKYGENCCLGCLPGGMTAVRTHMRLTYGIQVSCKIFNLTHYAWCFGFVLFFFDDLTLRKQIYFWNFGFTLKLGNRETTAPAHFRGKRLPSLSSRCRNLSNRREQSSTTPWWRFSVEFARPAGWRARSVSGTERFPCRRQVGQLRNNRRRKGTKRKSHRRDLLSHESP